jgi:hypothetical protein
MKSKKWFYGIIATIFALSLAGADIASAQGRGCGRGQGGGGRGVCMQTDQSQTTCPNYQQGQGRKRGQGRQQCLRNAPITQPDSTPALSPAPAPSN